MRYGIATLLVVVLLVLGAVAIFGGGSSSTGSSARSTKLADYSNNDQASVSWTMQGRLVGDDQRKAIRVTVTKNSRKIQILDGYSERIEKSQEYSNSEPAFASFTRALDGLNFGRERTVVQPDERGVCPQGNRYVYRVTEGTKEVMRTWSSTCSSNDGNFGGGQNNTSQITQLFRAQIADYNKFTTGIKL